MLAATAGEPASAQPSRSRALDGTELLRKSHPRWLNWAFLFPSPPALPPCPPSSSSAGPPLTASFFRPLLPSTTGRNRAGHRCAHACALPSSPPRLARWAAGARGGPGCLPQGMQRATCCLDGLQKTETQAPAPGDEGS